MNFVTSPKVDEARRNDGDGPKRKSRHGGRLMETVSPF